MNKQDTYMAYLLGIILLALTLHFTGLLDVTGSNDHHVTAFGQSWTIGANWGSDTGSCRSVVTDTSTNTSVSATVVTYNANTQCAFGHSIAIRLDNLDLRNYSKVVIHRSGTLTVPYIQRSTASGSSTIMGRTLSTTPNSQNNYDSLAPINAGDITIVRDANGVEVLYANPEAPAGYTLPVGPLMFSTTLSGASDGTVQESLAITGLELTPLPTTSTTTPVVTTPPLSYANDTTTTKPPVVALSLWDRIIAFLRGLFA